MQTNNNNNTTVLAIDPSITCTGYAVLTDSGDRLVAGGLIKPKRTDERMDKIRYICECVDRLVLDYTPDVAIIELTSGKVNRGRHTGGGAGLAVYGMCVGAVWKLLSNYDTHQTFGVYENDWTKGKGGKVKRKIICSLVYPNQYDPDKDSGGDLADAILIGRWFFDSAML